MGKKINPGRVKFVRELICNHPQGMQLTVAGLCRMVQKENPDCFKGLKKGPLSEWIRRRLPYIKGTFNVSETQGDIIEEMRMPRPSLHFPHEESTIDFEVALRSIQATMFPSATFGKILEIMDIMRTAFKDPWNILLQEVKRIPELTGYIQVLERRLDEKSHDNDLAEENANLKAHIARLEARCKALSQDLEHKVSGVTPTVVHSDPTR